MVCSRIQRDWLDSSRFIRERGLNGEGCGVG